MTAHEYFDQEINPIFKKLHELHVTMKSLEAQPLPYAWHQLYDISKLIWKNDLEPRQEIYNQMRVQEDQARQEKEKIKNEETLHKLASEVRRDELPVIINVRTRTPTIGQVVSYSAARGIKSFLDWAGL